MHCLVYRLLFFAISISDQRYTVETKIAHSSVLSAYFSFINVLPGI